MSGWAPIYFYWGLVLLGVLPLAPINRVAAIVVAARLGTQAAYDMGFNLPVSQSIFFNEPVSQVAIFGAAAIVAMHNARLTTCFFAAALFVPLSIAAAYQIDAPTTAGWIVYGLSVLQALILIASGEWRKAIRHWMEATDPDKPDLIHKLVAFARRRIRLYA